MTCVRPALSIWSAVYPFMREARIDDAPRPIPIPALEELQMALFLSPLFVARMDNDWSQTVFMMDASELGGAVIASEAYHSEIYD